jgi:hypothetical protein
MNKVWKESEKQFVRDNCARMTDQVLSEKLTDITGRRVTIHSIRKLRQSLGLRKKPGRGVCGLVEATDAPRTQSAAAGGGTMVMTPAAPSEVV